jgi:hypothetical protein
MNFRSHKTCNYCVLISYWRMSIGSSSLETQLNFQINRFWWLWYAPIGNTFPSKALNGLTFLSWDGQAPRVSIILFTFVMLTYSMTWVSWTFYPTFSSSYVVGIEFYKTFLNKVISRRNRNYKVGKSLAQNDPKKALVTYCNPNANKV